MSNASPLQLRTREISTGLQKIWIGNGRRQQVPLFRRSAALEARNRSSGRSLSEALVCKGVLAPH